MLKKTIVKETEATDEFPVPNRRTEKFCEEPCSKCQSNNTYSFSYEDKQENLQTSRTEWEIVYAFTQCWECGWEESIYEGCRGEGFNPVYHCSCGAGLAMHGPPLSRPLALHDPSEPTPTTGDCFMCGAKGVVIE